VAVDSIVHEEALAEECRAFTAYLTGLTPTPYVFRALRAGLGISNINLHDQRRDESYFTIEPLEDRRRTRLVLEYRDAPPTRHAVRMKPSGRSSGLSPAWAGLSLRA
jgi:hypothetical protein